MLCNADVLKAMSLLYDTLPRKQVPTFLITLKNKKDTTLVSFVYFRASQKERILEKDLHETTTFNVV